MYEGGKEVSVKLKKRTWEIYHYPNRHQMEIIKKKKRGLGNGKCERCGKKGTIVHHIDLGKKDHSLENLMIVCRFCHGYFHSNRNPAHVEKWKEFEPVSNGR